MDEISPKVDGRGGLSAFWDKVETRVKGMLTALFQWEVLAFLAACLATHVFFWATCMYLNANSVKWEVDRHPPFTVDATAACVGRGTEEVVCVRIAEQNLMATSRSLHHLDMMKSYQIWNFALVATAFWAATLGGSILILIGRQGWDQTDDKLKGLFLGLSVASAFFGGFPAIIMAGENAQSNKRAYLKYDNLAVEIRSYLLANDHPEVEPAAFVHELDGHLQELNAIYFDVDASHVDVGRTKILESTKDAG